jgi:serine O-acetyltransferase
VYSVHGDGPVTLGALAHVAVFFPGIYVVFLYRLCHHLWTRTKPAGLGKALSIPVFIVFRICNIIFGIEMNPRSHIGYGLLITHFGGVHIGPVNIGENCNISHAVTLGRSSRVAHTDRTDVESEFRDTPTLGDRVWVGPGAVIAGPVTLGDDAVVAANSLVTRDVPPRGIAMGVPATTVSHKGSFAQVIYRGMAKDPARAASLHALPTESPHGAGASLPAEPLPTGSLSRTAEVQ